MSEHEDTIEIRQANNVIEIDGPHGKYCFSEDDHLAFLRQTRDQLQHMVDTKNVRNLDHIIRDIAGYTAVIDSGSQKNAEMFIDAKHKDRAAAMRTFKDNLDVIDFMKKHNLWENGNDT